MCSALLISRAQASAARRLDSLEDADAAVEALLQQEAKAANDVRADVASDDGDDDGEGGGAPRVADPAAATPTGASSMAQSVGDGEGDVAEGAVVLHDEWLQEQEVDEVFEKELAAVLPAQVCCAIARNTFAIMQRAGWVACASRAPGLAQQY